MEAISRRHWFTWSAVACGATALGCRTPGMGEFPLSQSFQAPNLPAGSLEQPPIIEAPPVVTAGDSNAGVHVSLGDGPTATIWTDNFQDALYRAEADDKSILAFFTGSDFCQPCMRLRKEVVETPEFQEWAGPRFVLLELDYPRRTPQPAALQEQNRDLLSRYGVRSFPTVLVLSARGDVLAKAAYRVGGPQPWIQSLEAQMHS